MEGRVQGGRRVENDGKCPTNDVPASNAAVVAGLATAAAVGLSLTNVISARFLQRVQSSEFIIARGQANRLG